MTYVSGVKIPIVIGVTGHRDLFPGLMEKGVEIFFLGTVMNSYDFV